MVRSVKFGIISWIVNLLTVFALASIHTFGFRWKFQEEVSLSSVTVSIGVLCKRYCVDTGLHIVCFSVVIYCDFQSKFEGPTL